MLDVTVIIPTQDTRPEWLKETLLSVEEQTQQPKDVVVTRGGDVHDRLFKAVNNATTKYVLFLSDDDKLPPNFLESVYNFAEKHDVPIVATFLQNFGDNVGKHGPGLHPFFSSLISRKMFLDVGGFDKTMLQMADVDFWVRCFKKGYTWQVCPDTFYYYRKHDNQDSGTANWDLAREQYLKKHGKFID